MTKLDFSLRPPLETDVWPYIGFLADPEVSLWLEDACQGAVTYAQIYALLFGEKRQIRSIEVRGKFVGLTGLSEWMPPTPQVGFFSSLATRNTGIEGWAVPFSRQRSK